MAACSVNWIKTGLSTKFSVVNEIISGVNGVEAKVSKENLYGYKIVLAKPSYIVIVMTSPDGHGISDDITIEFDENNKEFHLLKTA